MTVTTPLMWFRGFPKPCLPAFCRPFRTRQNATLARVGQVISNRIEVIQSDWEDDLEDGRPDTAIFDNKHRSRVREINAILCALQREFPRSTFPEGVHPLDLRSEIESATTGRRKPTQMPPPKVRP